MKRLIALLLCAICAFGLLTGCKNSESESSGKLKIVTTIFPVYDWVRELTAGCGDVELSLLIDNGVDIHSFQPSARDIIEIGSCDMFVYVGGESDSWVTDALEEKINKDMTVVNLLDILGDKSREEKFIEGMSGEREEDPETDEHVWLSLKNAEIFTDSISDGLKKLLPGDKKLLSENAEKYKEELNALDKSYKKTVDSSEKKTLVFGDRFPFLYLTEDYGINYYAAFSGCSAETEASFNTIAFLADKVDKYKLNTILKIETSDSSIADTIKNATKSKNQKILTLDSMQSKTSEDIKNKVTYLSVMKDNLKVLKQALK